MLPVGNALRYTLGSLETAGRTLTVRSSPDDYLTAIWTEKALYVTREGVSLGSISTSAIMPPVGSAFDSCATILWKPVLARTNGSAPQLTYRLALVQERALAILDIGYGARYEDVDSGKGGSIFTWLLGGGDSDEEEVDDHEHPFKIPDDDEEPRLLPMKFRRIIKNPSEMAVFTCAAAGPHYILLGREDSALVAVTWNGDVVFEAQLKQRDSSPTASCAIKAVCLPAGAQDESCVIVLLGTGSVVSMMLCVPPVLQHAKGKKAPALTPETAKTYAPFIAQQSVSKLPLSEGAAAVLVAGVDAAYTGCGPSGPHVLLSICFADGSVEVFSGYTESISVGIVGGVQFAVPDGAHKLRWSRVARWSDSSKPQATTPKSTTTTSNNRTAVAWRLMPDRMGAPHLPIGAAPCVFATTVQHQMLRLFRLEHFGSEDSTANIRLLLEIPLFPHNSMPQRDEVEALEALLSSTRTLMDLCWSADGLRLLGPIRHLDSVTTTAVQHLHHASIPPHVDDDDDVVEVLKLPHMWALDFAQPVAGDLGALQCRALLSHRSLLLLSPPLPSSPSPTSGVHARRERGEGEDGEGQGYEWLVAEVSHHYLPGNAPLKFASVCPDGSAIAVAGKRGAAIFFPRKLVWRLFTTPSQERSILCRAVSWLTNKTVVLLTQAPKSDPTDQLRLQLYPRSHLDHTMHLCDEAASIPVGANVTCMATGLTLVTAGTLSPTGTISQHHTSAVMWIVVGYESGEQFTLSFYRVSFGTVNKEGGKPPSVSVVCNAALSDPIGVTQSIGHASPISDALSPCDGTFQHDKFNQVYQLDHGVDAAIVVKAAPVSMQASPIKVELIKALSLPASCGSRISSLGVFNTRVHLLPGAGVSAVGLKSMKATDWTCLLPRVMVRCSDGRCLYVDAALRTTHPISPPSPVHDAFLFRPSIWLPHYHTSLGYLDCDRESYVLVPSTRILDPVSGTISLPHSRQPLIIPSHTARQENADLCGIACGTQGQLAYLQHGQRIFPISHKTASVNKSLGKHASTPPPRSSVQVGGEIYTSSLVIPLVQSLLQACCMCADEPESIVYSKLTALGSHLKSTNADQCFAACCSILQLVIDLTAQEVKQGSTTRIGQALRLHGVAPDSVAVVSIVAKALQEYATVKSYPLQIVLDNASDHLDAGSHVDRNLLGCVLRWLKDIDMLLEVVATVGRTIEEDKVPILVPRAGNPRDLFHECLKRGKREGEAVDSATEETRIKYLRTATAYMLLLQEYAWRQHAAGRATGPTLEGIVTVVNGNLDDARQLLMATGLPSYMAEGLVGAPLILVDGIIKSESPNVGPEVSRPFFAAAGAETQASLLNIVDNVASYCARLRHAAVEQAQEVSMDTSTAPENWSLIGTVASMLGFGDGKGTVDIEAVIASDPVVRLLRAAKVYVLQEVSCKISRSSSGGFRLTLAALHATRKAWAEPDPMPERASRSTDVSAVLHALRGLHETQASWLTAQTLDARVVITETPVASLSHDYPHAGDMIKCVDGHSALGLSLDDVKGLLDAAPKECSLQVFRVVSIPLVAVLSWFIQT